MSSSATASKNVSRSSSSDSDPNNTSNRKMEHTQAQIDQVLSIMNTNVEKVLDRNVNISKLEATAEELHEGAKQFQANTSELRRKHWWKNSKVLLVAGLLLLALVIVTGAVCLT